MPTRASALRSDEPRRASRRLYLPSVHVPRRVHHDEHLLLWQVRGSADVILDDETCTLAAGHALWLPAGSDHALQVHENSVMLPMFFETADSATTLHRVSLIAVDRDLRTLFLACIQSQQTVIRPAANIARQILSIIEQQPAPSPKLPMPSTEAAAFVAESLRFNPGDDRSADELARGAHSSLRTVERAFKSETGMTLRQWRIRNRMETAGRLLRSAQSLEAVAHRVGYTDASAFRRVFKAHFGCTPSEYATRYARS